MAPEKSGELFDAYASAGKRRDMVDYEDVSFLEMLGYKQELFRGMKSYMNFAVNLTCINSAACVIVLYGTGLTSGGPVVMVWGWLVVAFFTMIGGLSLAEISSAYPVAGAVYHWAGQLCSRKWSPIVSYICGWFNFLGNAASDATFAYSFASFISGTLAASYAPEGAFDMTFPTNTSSSSQPGATSSEGVYTGLSGGETVAVAIGTSLVWSVVNGLRVDRQGWLNTAAAAFQLVSTIIVVVVMATLTPEVNTAEFVFTQWNNETGFDATGYVILLGVLYSLYSVSGYEAGAHLSEETKNAAVATPRGVVWACGVTSVVGFALTLVFCFTTVNIGAVLNNPYVGLDGAGQPVIALFYYAAGTRGGLALSILMIINLFFAGNASLTVTTRISFALARDGAFPGSSYIRKVSSKNQNPIGTVIFVFFVDAVILLIALSPTSAFFNVTALSTIGYHMSYAIPILLRVTTGRKMFRPNKFSLGRYADVVGWVAGMWLLVTSVILFFPSGAPVTADSMNYAVVVVAGALLIAGIWWFAVARHNFKGPPRTDDGQAFALAFMETGGSMTSLPKPASASRANMSSAALVAASPTSTTKAL